MSSSLNPGTLKVPRRRVLPIRDAEFAILPSFARALRQRGLLVRAESPTRIMNGWAETAEPWIAVDSIYETHLRRVAMEQVLATLRYNDASPAPDQ